MKLGENKRREIMARKRAKASGQPGYSWTTGTGSKTQVNLKVGIRKTVAASAGAKTAASAGADPNAKRKPGSGYIRIGHHFK